MAAYDPPREVLPIFNPDEYVSLDSTLTVADADLRYLQLSGGAERGSVLFQSGLFTPTVSNSSFVGTVPSGSGSSGTFLTDATGVALAGTQTITGAKTFSSAITASTINNGTFVGSFPSSSASNGTFLTSGSLSLATTVTFNGPASTASSTGCIYVNPSANSIFASPSYAYSTVFKDNANLVASGVITEASTVSILSGPSVGSGGGSIAANGSYSLDCGGLVYFRGSLACAQIKASPSANLINIPTPSSTDTFPLLGSTNSFTGNNNFSQRIQSTSTTYASNANTGAIYSTGGLAVTNVDITHAITRSLTSSFRGVGFHSGDTVTDSEAAGTITNVVLNSFGPATLASTNAVTTTNAISTYIASCPLKGANQTFDNIYALYINNNGITNASVNTAASFYINGAPNTTIATNSYSMLVNSGESHFGGVVSFANGITASGSSSLNFSGSTANFLTSTGNVTLGGNASAIVIGSGSTPSTNIQVASGGIGNIDFSNSSGVFKTSTGNCVIGGNASTITIGSGSTPSTNITVASGTTGAIDFSNSSGAFKTSGGAVTLGANTSTITIGSGSTPSTNITVASGTTGNIDFSNSSGLFKTCSGANTLNGLTTIAAGLKFASNGSTITRLEYGTTTYTSTIGPISAVDHTVNFANSFSTAPVVIAIPYATGGGTGFSDYINVTIRSAGTSSFVMRLANVKTVDTADANSTYAWVAWN